nr:tannase/feruloyl esterase family alpha/beta hydrolase [uncultured Limnohabitans sp.]
MTSNTPHTSPIATALACTLGATLIAGCSGLPWQAASPVQQLTPAVGASLQNCDALPQQFNFARTHIDSSARVAAGAMKQGDQPLPEHCRVTGQMNKRKGSDGRDYAIGFEMRLPQQWNGRFYYQGNGGLDGSVQPALGALGGGPITGALMQGFAVISSDAGHTGPQTPFFGMEPQARLDYGYQAVASLTPMAKALIQTAYGKAPDRSYIGGCSNGGRHTLVAASRLGDQYDGYLAGAPGYRLPNAALAQLWGAQQWQTLATPGATVKHPMNPNASLVNLETAFTVPERQMVGRRILDVCDALDGAQDGLVQNTQACQSSFNLQRDVKTCTAARDGSCLTAEQKQVVARVFAGGTTADGQPIYASFPYDTGVAGGNWAMWKFVNALALDPLAVGAVFSSPPDRVDPLKIDINARPALFAATNATYTESGMSLMTPPGHNNPTNLTPLRERGAKMMVYHGVSDPIFSADDSRQWWLRVNQAQDGKAADFARYFPVPGMLHCSGGAATDQFDLLTPLVKWVEQGIAPQAPTASVRHAAAGNPELPNTWAPNRSRPLCAYPTTARYNGSGSIEDASNFACR